MTEADHQNYDPQGKVRATLVLLGLVALACMFFVETMMGFRVEIPIAIFIGFLVIADYKGIFLKCDNYCWGATILAIMMLAVGFLIGLEIEIERGQELGAYLFGTGFICWGVFAIAERIWPSIARKSKLRISD